MKQLAFVLIIGLAGCSGAAGPSTLEMEDSGSTLVLEAGDTFVVTLHGNPTTGFAWLVDGYDESVLQMTGETFTDENTNGRVGAGGAFAFEFEAERAGETDVVLHYRRSWEERPAERVFTVHLVVG